ncbi:hypothetical protein FHG66_15945 [Rubellimicrobium rubrum]|uniref:Uncharacterized protein n=1 Tax=Rubellimicrobium rubrum TaxID=2585369 RepID=A0A5C4MTN9_9RHOB|nr:hypothetical protein [Rubellimicrobium rubrum]TNC47710.1 hypothetical protein FHG66_15945 [Rubellimicrobium rubrum]
MTISMDRMSTWNGRAVMQRRWDLLRSMLHWRTKRRTQTGTHIGRTIYVDSTPMRDATLIGCRFQNCELEVYGETEDCRQLQHEWYRPFADGSGRTFIARGAHYSH